MTKTNFEDVRDFHVRFNQLAPFEVSHLTWRKLKERIDFMQEELTEFDHAAETQDMPKMFDALLDLVYVAMGSAVMMGLPWQEGWNEIQRANMAKVNGPTHRTGASNDVCKPPGWIGPDHETILDRHQYEFLEWFPENNINDETQCLDDVSTSPMHQQAFPK